MTIARKEIVLKDKIRVYHCISRCVRRAFLCGYDSYLGKCFDHRKDWVLERLKFLSEIFAIDVLGYALMSTHNHTMLRNRPDIVKTWSDEEVAERWLKLFPKRRDHFGKPAKPTVEEIEAITVVELRVNELRARLSCISWFMKSLNEYIARRANHEDECSGRFWEGRFKSIRLDDESAILSCAIYVDLNPIRSNTAPSPEESTYTSAYERIENLKNHGNSDESNLWLNPINDSGERKGFLSIDLDTYLRLLDETGRVYVKGKQGRISPDLKPILERLDIRANRWFEISENFSKMFSYVAGTHNSMLQAAKDADKSWYKGIRASKYAFHS